MSDELLALCLNAYLDRLDSAVGADRLAAWAKSEGLAVTRRNGIVVVYRGGRVVAAFDTAVSRGTKHRPIPRERCWTCGARPVGVFINGLARYDCHVRDPERHVPTTSKVPLWGGKADDL